MNRIVIGLVIAFVAYVIWNEHRLWDYEHVAWDAQTGICISLPAHCAGGQK